MQNQLFQQPSSQGIFYWIHGEEVAKGYLQPYGTTALYLDTEDPVFFIRTVDIQGNTTAFATYDYTQRVPPTPPTYATTDDLGAIDKRLEAMQKMIEDMARANNHRNNKGGTNTNG